MSNEKSSNTNLPTIISIASIILVIIGGAYTFGTNHGKNEINAEYHKAIKDNDILSDSIKSLHDTIKKCNEFPKKKTSNLDELPKKIKKKDAVIKNPNFKINEIKPTQK